MRRSVDPHRRHGGLSGVQASFQLTRHHGSSYLRARLPWRIRSHTHAKYQVGAPVGASVSSTVAMQDVLYLPTLTATDVWVAQPAERESLRAARNALAHVAQAAATADWDGYGALPVSDLSVRAARWFLSEIPAHLPMPEIGAEPDGEIAIEWAGSSGFALSISFSTQGLLTYAAIFGDSHARGTEAFVGSFPAIIAVHLDRVLSSIRPRVVTA